MLQAAVHVGQTYSCLLTCSVVPLFAEINLLSCVASRKAVWPDSEYKGPGAYWPSRKAVWPDSEHKGPGAYWPHRKAVWPDSEHKGLGAYWPSRKALHSAPDDGMLLCQLHNLRYCHLLNEVQAFESFLLRRSLLIRLIGLLFGPARSGT